MGCLRHEEGIFPPGREAGMPGPGAAGPWWMGVRGKARPSPAGGSGAEPPNGFYPSRRARAVIAPQSPAATSAAGVSHDPPTATTFGSASQVVHVFLRDPARGAEACVGERPGQGLQRGDAARGGGGEELHRLEAAGGGLHQLGGGGDAGQERDGGGRRLVQQRGGGAGAEREAGAGGDGPAHVGRRQHRADAHHRLRHVTPDRLGGGQAHGGAQRHLQQPHAAGHQGARQRHRVLQPVDGDHRDHPAMRQQRGELGGARRVLGHGGSLVGAGGAAPLGGLEGRVFFF